MTTLVDMSVISPKKMKSAVQCAALFFIFAALLSACTPRPKEHLLTGDIMGTQYHIKCVDEKRNFDPEQLHAAVLESLERVDALMSTYKSDSELSRFNSMRDDALFPLSQKTFEVMSIAQEVSRVSGGAFDITVGPLVNAYGFGPEFVGTPPSPEELDTLKRNVGYTLIELDTANRGIRKHNPEVYCDLSAVAKGYAVDKVCETLDAKGVANYMVEVGGEVRVRGHNLESKAWRIAIETPDETLKTIYRVLPMGDGGLSASRNAMATSGDYRNFILEDGKRISHTIDPRTGKSISHNLASVSVIHESCAWADALATTMMVMGVEEGLKLAEEHNYAVYLIIRNGDTFETRQSSTFPNMHH